MCADLYGIVIGEGKDNLNQARARYVNRGYEDGWEGKSICLGRINPVAAVAARGRGAQVAAVVVVAADRNHLISKKCCGKVRTG